MRKYLFIMLLLLTPFQAFAAITFDNASSNETNTLSFALAGNYLFVCAEEYLGTGDITATFDGVSLTPANGGAVISNSFFRSQCFYGYGLPTVTANIVITGTYTGIYTIASSYSGVAQSPPEVEQVGVASSASSYTDTLSTITDGAYHVLFVMPAVNTITAVSPLTLREYNSGPPFAAGDNYVATAGSDSVTVDYDTNGGTMHDSWSIAPSAGGGGGGGSSSTSTASMDQSEENLFNGFMVFLASFLGMVWLLRKH